MVEACDRIFIGIDGLQVYLKHNIQCQQACKTLSYQLLDTVEGPNRQAVHGKRVQTGKRVEVLQLPYGIALKTQRSSMLIIPACLPKY